MMGCVFHVESDIVVILLELDEVYFHTNSVDKCILVMNLHLGSISLEPFSIPLLAVAY